MGTVRFNGYDWPVPDDATDEEILELFEQQDPIQQPNPEPATAPLLEDKWVPESQDQYPDQSPYVEAVQRTGPKPGESLTNPTNASAAYEAARSVTDELGTMAGLPIEAFTAFGRLGGYEGLQAGEGLAYFKQFLNDHGFPQGQIDSLAGRFGSDLTWNLVLTGAGIGVGKGMLKPFFKPGGQLMTAEEVAGSQIGRYKIGRGLAGAPGQQVAGAIGGSATQAIGEGTYGEDPASALLSYMPGAVVGSYGGRRVKDVFSRFYQDKITKPLVNPLADKMAPKIAAEDRVSRDIQYIDEIIEEATEGRVGMSHGGVRPWNLNRSGGRHTRMTDAQAQARFEESRDWAETTIRQVEERYWNSALAGQPIETTDLLLKSNALMEDMLQEGTEATTPTKFFKELEKWAPAVQPQKVQALIRDLYAERRRIYKHNSDFSGDKGAYARNLDRLEDQLREAMEAKISDPRALAEARAITSARKARFMDGPMGEARYMEGRGRSVSTNPVTGRVEEMDFAREGAAPLIARTQGGPAQVRAVQTLMNQLGIRSSIADDFENAVRTDYLESIYKPGEQMPDLAAADKWLRNHQSTIAPYKSLLREIEQHVALIRTNMDKKKAIYKGVYAKVANASDATMQAHVDNAFTHPDAVRRVRTLTDTFSVDNRGRKLPGDHEYIQAWEQLVVNTLLKKSGHDAQKLQHLMNQPMYKGLLKEAFRNNPQTLERLQRATDLAVNMMTEGVKGDIKGLARNQAIFFAGIFGAKFGTMLNSGSIQIPGYFARSSRSLIQRLMDTVLPKSPGDKLYWAIHTPEGYNWMTRNVYEGTPGLRKSVRQGRRLLALMNTQTHEATRRWLDEVGVRPREEAEQP